MSQDKPGDWFEGIEEIVSDPLRFKAKLAIGEDAYASIRVKNAVFELWDAAGAAGTAAAVAQSTTVASTFFAPSGVLAFIGIGTAVTPLVWVVAAGIVAGGGWIGVTRYLKQGTGSRVTTIPDFINTPMDVLALGLFDLMVPLALKIAAIDGNIDPSEKEAISAYFANQWGYDADFVREGMTFIEKKLDEFSVKDLVRALGEFQKGNPDCNFKEMSKEIIRFLGEIIEADGRIDEREEMAIEKAQATFDEVAKYNLKSVVTGSAETVAGVVRKIPHPKLPFWPKSSE